MPTRTELAFVLALAACAPAFAADVVAPAHPLDDPAAVKAAYPGLTPDEARALDRSFLDYSAYRLEFEIVRTTFRGGRATVNAAIETTVTLRSGEQRRSTSSATFVMENMNGAWVVLSASRLPN